MIKKTIPLLPLRDIVVFPGMVAPLFVGRKLSVIEELKPIEELFLDLRLL